MSGLDWTACPHCHEPLTRTGRALRCPVGHSYDVARQGYVNLLGQAPPANADTADMLDARSRFLAAGHYDDVALAVGEGVTGRRVVEVGAGTAFYLSWALDEHPDAEGLATDVSVAAAKRAARAHPRVAAVVADTWAGLPLVDASVDTIVCVFAPRNPAEFARVLQPGGTLVVAQPAADHLIELRERYGLLGVAADKVDRLGAAFPGWTVSSRREVRSRASLTAVEVADLIAMGPNAFHGLPGEVGSAEVQVSVDVLALRSPGG